MSKTSVEEHGDIGCCLSSCALSEGSRGSVPLSRQAGRARSAGQSKEMEAREPAPAAASNAAAAGVPPPPGVHWDETQVAEYLARWQVEETVQQAVNSALSVRAIDPVLHIAGFLEARGKALQEQHDKQLAQAAAAAAAPSSAASNSRSEPG